MHHSPDVHLHTLTFLYPLLYVFLLLFAQAFFCILNCVGIALLIIIISTAPSAPVDFAAEVVASTIILASWETPNSTNGIITSYNLYYARETNGQFPVEINVSVIATEDVHSYNITLTNLTANTQYRLQVSAFTKVGEGEQSSRLFVTTNPASSSPPSFISAIVLNSTAVRLTWGYPELPRSTILGYIILYNVEPHGPDLDVNLTLSLPNDMSNQSIVVSNLKENTVYSFSVAAYSADHVGVYGDPVIERTLEDGMWTFH